MEDDSVRGLATEVIRRWYVAASPVDRAEVPPVIAKALDDADLLSDPGRTDRSVENDLIKHIQQHVNVPVYADNEVASDDPRTTLPSKDQRKGDRHTGPRQRSVRGISDELWRAAKEKAAREGSSLSDVVEALLARWTKEP